MAGRQMLRIVLSVLAIAPIVQAQQLEAITVPWLGDPFLDHQVYSGGTLTLQGVAEVPAGAQLTSAEWDPGDGSGPQAVPFTNPLALELAHTYTGIDGQPFVATLTVRDSSGGVASDTFRVRIQPRDLDVEVNMAIDHGLWHLHKRLNRTVINNVPAGNWTHRSDGDGAATASAVQAMAVNGHLENGDRSEDPYVDDVARGLAFTMTQLQSFALTMQPAGDPDVNGNGIGLRFPRSHQVYTMGQLVDGIIAAGLPNTIARTGEPTNVEGREYVAIVEDIMEAYYWGQVDSGSRRGGWRYNLNSDGDNSAAQWMAIGGIPAVREYGLRIPQFVKDENQVWLENTQVFTGSHSGTDGRWGYTSATSIVDVNGMNTTPSGLVQMIVDDQDRTQPRWVSAEKFMAREFSRLTGNNRIYGMFATAKGMRLALPSQIELLDGVIDWYADPDDGFAPHLVATQHGDGSWDGGRWVVDDLATAWALIILSPTIIGLPPVAVCDADPVVTGVNVPILFDGTGSFHTDPGKVIREWEWDFDADGTPDAFGPIVMQSFGAQGTFPVRLTVRDNSSPPRSSTDNCTVRIVPPPIPPNADPGGPYVLCIGLNRLVLNGANSSDPDGQIVSWDWDYDPQPLDLSFDDASGETVDVTDFFTNLGPGQYDVGLRVTDNNTLQNTDFTTVRVFPEGQCPFVPPVFDDEARCGQVQGATVGAVFQREICASDPDMGDIVTLTSSSLPAGATLSTPLPATGNPVCTTLRWTPTNTQIGRHVIEFTARDMLGLETKCQIIIEVAECFLMVAEGFGGNRVTAGTHTFETQLRNVRRIYPVTMERNPRLRIPSSYEAPSGGEGGEAADVQQRVLWGTAQIVMWNPQLFPTNPEQSSHVMAIWIEPDGSVTVERGGKQDGISIGNRQSTRRGRKYVKFPFTINGL